MEQRVFHADAFAALNTKASAGQEAAKDAKIIYTGLTGSTGSFLTFQKKLRKEIDSLLSFFRKDRRYLSCLSC